MKKFNDLVVNLDEKINPKIAKILFLIFKFTTLFLIIIGTPVIALTFGALSIVPISMGTSPQYAYTNQTVEIVFGVWISITIVSSLLWFYFSKWNV